MTQYALDVVEGRILAGRLVRLACERHLRDLTDLVARGYRFDEQLADHATGFFPRFLRLYDAGDKTGEPFTLGPAWVFIVGSLFGWIGPDGTRRFRTAYIEMGKGNAKSPALAGIGLYGITLDEEPGAQVFSAAVTREQARILFDDAKNFASASPELQEELVVGENNIAHPTSKSFIRPISSEGRSLDGKRVHMALIDEIHEHPTGLVVNKLRFGTKARRRPMILEITNSGYDRKSVCWEHHELSRRILDRIDTDESWFGYVCQLDVCATCTAAGRDMPQEGCPDCDNWRDERVWLKTNPNLDISVTRDYLRRQVASALQLPSTQSLVRRLNFCAWTEGASRWIPTEAWQRCGVRRVVADDLRGRPCIAGIDLSLTTDLTALELVFPDDDFAVEIREVPGEEPTVAVQGGVDVLSFFWCPEDGIRQRSVTDRVPYELWRDQGFLEATPGNVIDYRWIVRRIKELRKTYDIAEICYDPAFATQIALQLQDEHGFVVVPVSQGFESINEPALVFERLTLAGALGHGNHPLLSWCASNVVADTDGGGRRRPSKGKSTERIDGISAVVTAFKRLPVATQRVRAIRSRPEAIVGDRRVSVEAPW